MNIADFVEIVCDIELTDWQREALLRAEARHEKASDPDARHVERNPDAGRWGEVQAQLRKREDELAEQKIGLQPCYDRAMRTGKRCILPAGHQPPGVHQAEDGGGWFTTS